MMFVEIGAPSITGRSANQDVEKVFGQAKFPLEITFENFMPRRVAFPEVLPSFASKRLLTWQNWQIRKSLC